MKPWTKKEESTLRKNAQYGADHCAMLLGRSRRSVVCKASELGVSLRRPGCRKGLRLGQPRNTSLKQYVTDPELVEALADPVTATRLINAVRAYRDTSLASCPSCGGAIAKKTTSGFCETCHFEHLAQAWREDKARRKARTEYLRERERGKRRVVCSECKQTYSPRLDREGRKSDRTLCPECRRKEQP